MDKLPTTIGHQGAKYVRADLFILCVELLSEIMKSIDREKHPFRPWHDKAREAIKMMEKIR